MPGNASQTDLALLDFLMPATDAGVAAQFTGWPGLSVVAFIVTRHNRDLRLLAVGISILVLGVMTVRAVH